MNKETITNLKELSNLLDKQVISQEEFNNQKKVIFNHKNSVSFSLDSIHSLFKLFSPQLVILIIIILFYTPLKRLLTNASEVAFGDVFALKVERALIINNPSLAKKLKELSRDELFVLMSSGSNFRRIAYVDRKNQTISIDKTYEFYLSLYEKKLAISYESVDEIVKILESKATIKEDNYQDSLLLNTRSQIYSTNDFTEEEINKIENLSFGLSEQGKQVLLLIISIGSEEISRID